MKFYIFLLSSILLLLGLVFLNSCCDPADSSPIAPVNNAPAQPSTPNPADNSIDQLIVVDLSWVCSDPDGDPLTYDVFFSTVDPPTSVIQGQSGTSYDPDDLEYNQLYYWSIVALDGQDTTEGEIWSFTTIANQPPQEPSNPSPVDGAIDQPLNVELSWSSSDPEGGELTYDIYFGTTDPPQSVSQGQTDTTYSLSGLDYNQLYYWQVVAVDDYGNSIDGQLWNLTTVVNQAPSPPDPLPIDGAIDQQIDLELSWTSTDVEGDLLTYDVYFGTADPPDLVASDIDTAIYDPEMLIFSQTYFWKIVVEDSYGNVTEGDVWSLTTMIDPNLTPTIPSDPLPADRAANQPLDVDLRWTCSDPENDPLTYDVYFGTSREPELLSQDQSQTIFDPGDMIIGQRYYWKIVAKDDHDHITEGPLWSFTTPDPAAGFEREFVLYEQFNVTMIWIPEGSFDMGSADDEVDHEDDEGPVHNVTHSSGFWMSKYEVTQDRWEGVTGENPATGDGIGPNKPAIMISWASLPSFFDRIPNGFRLPSESEWEYAYRAGTTTRYPWGDDLDNSLIGDYSVYVGNSNRQLAEVGTKLPNPWGLYDMSGNVWEFCADDYHDSYNGAPEDGSAWVDDPRADNRSCSGGSFLNTAKHLRSANRVLYSKWGAHPSFGFRLVYDR